MKTKSFFKLLCVAVIAAVAVTACYDDMFDAPDVGLGALEKEFLITPLETAFYIDTYANGPYHIEGAEEAEDWLTLTPGEIVDGVSRIQAKCDFNDRFKRMVTIVLCSDLDTRRDTLTIKQEGSIEAFMEFDDAAIIISQYGGQETASVRTNVLFEEMDMTIEYGTEGEEWITDLTIVNGENDEGVVYITAGENTNEKELRIAAVTLSFTDGWGDEVHVNFNIVQYDARGQLGDPISFTDFELQYADFGEISDYVILEGYIVSNPDSFNAGEPDQTAYSTVDRTPTYTTVYMESVDGSRGLKFVTNTIDDNIFNQYDRVGLLVKGCEATQKTEPNRLELTGVTRLCIVSQVPGTKDDLPVKERTIGSLTDDDVYTYVKLVDVELPIRKGPIFPCSETSTVGGQVWSMDNLTASNCRVPKFGALVRDRNGDALYMWTNDQCGYRRQGRRPPQGSGNLYGVIVHERYARYEFADGADPLEMEDDPNLGNVGRYQIRHQSEDDIWGEMNMDFKDSFSELLTEYRYFNRRGSSYNATFPTYCKEVVNTDNFYDYANGTFTHTYQTKYTGDSNKNAGGSSTTHVTYIKCYNYLGPIGRTESCYFGKHWGNQNGLGIVCDPKHDYIPAPTSSYYKYYSFAPDGTIEYAGQYAEDGACGSNGPTTGWISDDDCANQVDQPNYLSSDNRGKGQVGKGSFSAFSAQNWWDYDTNRFYSFLLKLDTSNITTDQLSLQISVVNHDSSYGPRYWVAEWALTDSQAPEDDDQWNYIAEYTVPDFLDTNFSNWFGLGGYKPINFKLPLEMLGHSEVYIRLHPTSDVCSDGDDYANAIWRDGPQAVYSAIDYIAVRYNK